MRDNGCNVSAAVIIAVGVDSDGWREGLGMDIGPSQVETFWTDLPHVSSGGAACAA
jgi:transposase-like protein